MVTFNVKHREVPGSSPVLTSVEKKWFGVFLQYCWLDLGIYSHSKNPMVKSMFTSGKVMSSSAGRYRIIIRFKNMQLMRFGNLKNTRPWYPNVKQTIVENEHVFGAENGRADKPVDFEKTKHYSLCTNSLKKHVSPLCGETWKAPQLSRYDRFDKSVNINLRHIFAIKKTLPIVKKGIYAEMQDSAQHSKRNRIKDLEDVHGRRAAKMRERNRIAD